MARMPVKDLPDTTADRAAAEQQAAKIRAFWAAKGQPAEVWVQEEKGACNDNKPVYVVRSTISLLRKRRRA